MPHVQKVISAVHTSTNNTIYASAARTATPTANQINGKHIGAQIIINVTAASATPSVVPTVDGYDEVSDTWYTLLTGAAITATGQTVLTVHPWITAAANTKANDFLPPVWRVVMTHADADSITYSVGYNGIG